MLRWFSLAIEVVLGDIITIGISQQAVGTRNPSGLRPSSLGRGGVILAGD